GEPLTHAREHAVLLGGDRSSRGIFAAQFGELLEQLALFVVELVGGEHVDGDEQVAAGLRAQTRGAESAQLDHRARLGARGDAEVLGAVEGLERDRRAQGGRGHRHGHGGAQVVAIALEDVVAGDHDLDEEVSGRPAAGADFALARQLDPGAVGDTGGDADLHRPLFAHAAVALAVEAGLGMTVPKPWQELQVWFVTIWPSRVRVMRWTLPAPWHRLQVSIEVPSWVPAPEQVSHTTAVVTSRSTVPPKAAVSRSMLTPTRASLPRWVRGIGPPAWPPPPPKKVSKMSPNPPNP